MASSSLVVIRYKNASSFFEATHTQLEKLEAMHSFPLWAASELSKSELGHSYCGAVWNDSECVFAIVGFDNGNIFPTQSTNRLAIRLLLQDMIQTPLSIQGMMAYNPCVDIVLDLWPEATHPFKSHRSLWSYELRELSGTATGRLRLATLDDLPLLLRWMLGFHEESFGYTPSDEQLQKQCLQLVETRSTFMWSQDDFPIAMVATRRILRHGCSIGYVYTPIEQRRQGYATAAVRTICAKLLKTFSYVTLIVDGIHPRDDNLYTRVGFRYIGSVAHYECQHE